MTNADRHFRKATDEELARIIVTDWCEVINCECQMWRACDGQCEGRVLAWLKGVAQDAVD